MSLQAARSLRPLPPIAGVCPNKIPKKLVFHWSSLAKLPVIFEYISKKSQQKSSPGIGVVPEHHPSLRLGFWFRVYWLLFLRYITHSSVLNCFCRCFSKNTTFGVVTAGKYLPDTAVCGYYLTPPLVGIYLTPLVGIPDTPVHICFVVRAIGYPAHPAGTEFYTTCPVDTLVLRMILPVDFWLYEFDHQVEQATSPSVQQTIPKTTRVCTSMQKYMPHMLHAWDFMFGSAGHWQSRNLLPADLVCQ